MKRGLILACFVTACAPNAAPHRMPAAAEHAAAAKPAVEQVVWSAAGCTRAGCHQHVEPIRQPDSEMMKKILVDGARYGDPDGCVVCHGGTPAAATAALAHAGTVAALRDAGGPDAFFPDPGSPWVNARSCGRCHPTEVEAQWTSLMMSEAGEVQGNTWAFGGLEGYDHKWGNYDVRNASRVGTDAYRAYMATLAKTFPHVFQPGLTTMPPAPGAPGGVTLDDLAQHPEQSGYTYLRTECMDCHLAVKGRARRGDYRGMGCSACHMPYGVEGFYEGHDEAMPHDARGYPLVHELQGTRTDRVSIHGTTYSGIPVETCATCHNRGERIGVSYQGLMESAYDSPYTQSGGGQTKLHGKSYIAMHADVHFEKGMLCQDCHTSGDVHGDGTTPGTNGGAVEIECTDCHGTPTRFPWELPLGWGDRSGPDAATGAPRGVAHAVPDYLKQGYVADAPDGWLLTARGNPMPNVTRDGEDVVVHLASGKDLRIEPLKAKLERGRLSVAARTAMVSVSVHLEKMECYTCHSSWVPQCYGCHVKIDYSTPSTSIDWTAAGHAHLLPEHRTARGEDSFAPRVPGRITETRSYLRWEDPALGINGEGRVAPIAPGCQVVVTVIGKDGTPLLKNHVFRTPPETQGGGADGQLSLDMAPYVPHTVGKARPCESCHTSEKALGYGIGAGTMAAPMDSGRVVELQTADGKVLSTHAGVQIEAIRGLGDWSQVVTPNGKQTQTVGHHFPGSGPLPADVRARMDRRNVCLSCHQHIPKGDVPLSLLHHLARVTGQLPNSDADHQALLSRVVRVAAWAEVLAPLAALAGFIGVLVIVVRRRRRRRPAHPSS